VWCGVVGLAVVWLVFSWVLAASVGARTQAAPARSAASAFLVKVGWELVDAS